MKIERNTRINIVMMQRELPIESMLFCLFEITHKNKTTKTKQHRREKNIEHFSPMFHQNITLSGVNDTEKTLAQK